MDGKREREKENPTHLSPERPQPSSLQHLPPLEVLRERLIPDMDLELQLAEGERTSRSDIWTEEGSEGLEFPAFDINLEDVDMCVACSVV